MDVLYFLESLNSLKYYDFDLPDSFKGYNIYDTKTTNTLISSKQKTDEKYITITANTTGSTVILMPPDIIETNFLNEARVHVREIFLKEIKELIKEYKETPKRDDFLDRRIIKLIRSHIRRDTIDSYLNEYMHIVQIGCLRSHALKF